MNNIAVDNTDVAMIVNSPADHMAHASLWLRLESSIGSVVMRAKLIKTMPMNTPSPVRALSARTTRRATISRSKSRSSESNTMLRPLAATAAETNAVEAQLKQCNDPRAAVNTHDQATVAPKIDTAAKAVELALCETSELSTVRVSDRAYSVCASARATKICDGEPKPLGAAGDVGPGLPLVDDSMGLKAEYVEEGR